MPFPAPAGLNRPCSLPTRQPHPVPRTRGDEPFTFLNKRAELYRSPHPRG